jgi:hypothetical protein
MADASVQVTASGFGAIAIGGDNQGPLNTGPGTQIVH